ncbi:hypothetical protein BDY19DRAFT_916771 [Irpex rosettiformis]|uniref:Uncharacterized protein n=1 Tax=Irpex rosettiformis TaxID=378272 RepID=A0ACB8UM38_9APHY|nr:hypothetical protein BDY19DRAFT_916771 [Irpex rosettiformis]
MRHSPTSGKNAARRYPIHLLYDMLHLRASFASIFLLFFLLQTPYLALGSVIPADAYEGNSTRP